MSKQLYFDYAATTPLDDRVIEKMTTCLKEEFGNPASRSHAYGWKAEELVETARKQVADLINADEREIIWTSGATESNNLAIKGAAQFYQRKGRHIITSKIEHKAVLDTCRLSNSLCIPLLRPQKTVAILHQLHKNPDFVATQHLSCIQCTQALSEGLTRTPLQMDCRL